MEKASQKRKLEKHTKKKKLLTKRNERICVHTESFLFPSSTQLNEQNIFIKVRNNVKNDMEKL